MTDTSPTLAPTVYLSGPMTGVPEYNYPAFNAEAARLRRMGYRVINPTESFGGDQARPRYEYMRLDIEYVLAADIVATLPGWEDSRGATLEVNVAREIGTPVQRAADLPRLPVCRIALAGYSRVGKDAVGAILMGCGLHRVALGDIIKRQLDPLVRAEMGFSAFTEVDAEKSRIRGTLEQWGYDNYEAITRELYDRLPLRAVNTRLFRDVEAREWIARGGEVWGITRPGYGPHTTRERDELSRLYQCNYITRTITNDSTLDGLRATVQEAISDHRKRASLVTLVDTL